MKHKYKFGYSKKFSERWQEIFGEKDYDEPETMQVAVFFHGKVITVND